MKKIISLIIILILICPQGLAGLENKASLETYDQGNHVSGDCLGKMVELSNELKGMMVAIDNKLCLLGNDDFAVELKGTIKDFKVIDDLDADGIKDLIVIVKVNAGYNNVKLVSSQSSKILFEFKLTHETVNDDGNRIIENSLVRQILIDGKYIYLLYDRHILGIDSHQKKVIFDHEEDDNVWKMIIAEKQLIFTNQLGQLVSIDKTNGKEKYRHDYGQSTKIKNKYVPNKIEKIKLNLWDLAVIDDTLYVTTENERLLKIDINNGTLKEELGFDLVAEKNMRKRLREQCIYDISNNEDITISTGVYSKAFNGFQIKIVNQNLMLIMAYLGDWNYTPMDILDSNNNGIKPSLLLVDYQKMEVVHKINIEAFNLASTNVLLTMYQGEEVLLLVDSYNEGGLYISAYRLSDGQVVKRNLLRNLDMPKENLKVHLTAMDTGYLLQIASGSSYYLEKDLKTIKSLYNAKTIVKIKDVADGVFVSSTQNGAIDGIIKFSNHGKNDVLMHVTPPNNYTNRGFEAITYDETSEQILALVNEVDKQDQVLASHLVIIDVHQGCIISDKKVFLATNVDENNRVYKQYLIGKTIKYFTDLNDDGKREILVDQMIIDGKTFEYKGEYHQDINEGGLVFETGDLNGDEITDLICFNEKQMQIYYSKNDSFTISYQKSNIVKRYDSSLLNHQHALCIGDLGHQGINFFVINARNKAGNQYYQVIDSRDLSVKFNLMSDGVRDWGESFASLDVDLNNDNYDEFAYYGPNGEYQAISGKDGSVVYQFTKDIFEEDIVPTPLEQIVPFKFNEIERGNIKKLEDLNQDGVAEFGYLDSFANDTNDLILKIIDGKTLKLLKKCNLAGIKSFNEDIVTVPGQKKLIVYDGEISQIYDYEKNKLVAGCRWEIKNVRQLSDGRMLLENNNGNLAAFDDRCDFELVNFNHNKLTSGYLHVKYKSSQLGMMSVYDRGNLILQTTDSNLDIKLLDGKHRLVFSFDDGLGKITHLTKDVVVTKNDLIKYLVILIALVFIFIGSLICVYPKYHLKQKLGENNVNSN